MQILDICIRVIIGLAFIYAGVTKISDPGSFAETIEAFGILPLQFVNPASIILPVVEIIFGAGFIAGNRESIYIITALLLVFMAALIYGIVMGFDIDCGCYGPDDNVGKSFSSLKTSLIRDILMITGIIFIFYYRSVSKR